MAPNLQLEKDSGAPFHDPERYRRLVGKLNYLTVTRLDIAFAVSVASRFMSARTVSHWALLEQILCYLKGASGPDYACCKDDRRSTSGYCIFVGGNLVSWRSKKQNVVSRRFFEARI
ncbi:hypothetical protein DH2020_045441 [Rehmannia glutinosa]|uniref:Mitochondrial protein n=1 Tax=Rehmannia glutinosa TaxID=99300 RepID=A0ABR0UEU6_REHGL